MNNDETRQAINIAAREITEGLAEARRSEALSPELIEMIAEASSALMADLAIAQAAKESK